MADLNVKVGADVSEYEAGMAKIRDLTQNTVGNVTSQVNGQATAISKLRTELFGWWDAAKKATDAQNAANDAAKKAAQAQDEMRQSLTRSIDKFGEINLAAIAGIGSIALWANRSVQAAADFEDAFTNIKLTSQLAADGAGDAAEKYDALAKNLLDLSVTTGTAAESLAGIAASAGRLGVRGVEDITAFTESVAKIAVATEVSAGEVIASFSKIASSTNEPMANVDRFGSTLAALAATSKATAGQILETSQFISGIGAAIGLTTPQILGMGAALASTGASGGYATFAFNQLLTTMDKAVKSGSGQVKLMTELAGSVDDAFKSTSDFVRIWNSDPARAIQAVLGGIGKSGKDATTALGYLGLEGGRAAKTIIDLSHSMSTANDNLTQMQSSLKTAALAWTDNTALAETFAMRMDGLNAATHSLWAAVKALTIEAFTPLLPSLTKSTQALTEFVQAMRQYPAITAFMAALAEGVAVFLTLGGAAALLVKSINGILGVFTNATLGSMIVATTAYFVDLTVAIGGVVGALIGGEGLMAALGTLAVAIGPTGWVVLALGTIATAMYLFVQYTEAGARAWKEFKNLLAGGQSDMADAMNGALNLGTAVDTANKAVQGYTGTSDRLSASTAKMAEGLKAVPNQFADVAQATAEANNKVTTSTNDMVKTVGGMVSKEQIPFLMEQAKKAFQDTQINIEKANVAIEDSAARGVAGIDAVTRQQVAGIDALTAAMRTRVGVETGLIQYDPQVEQKKLALRQQLDQAIAKGENDKVKAITASLVALHQAALQQETIFRDLNNTVSDLYDSEWEKLIRTTQQKGQDLAKTQIDVLKQKGAFEGSGTNALDLTEMLMSDYEGYLRYLDTLPDRLKAPLQRIEAVYGRSGVVVRNALTVPQKTIDDFGAAINSVGLFGEAMFKQQQAFQMSRRAYEDLSADQRRDVDEKAQSLAAADRLSKMTALLTGDLRSAILTQQAESDAFGKTGVEAERYRLARLKLEASYDSLNPKEKQAIDLLVQEQHAAENTATATALLVASHGQITQAVGMELAEKARLITQDQATMDAAIKVYQTINSAAQQSQIKQATFDKEVAENHGDMLGFISAATRQWAAQQPTIWQGLGTMITNTFDQVSRSLSDVFFNVFTNQTLNLQDVWKQLLNAMLRELANFLATSTVRFFLQMLGGLMNGQSLGDAASGALGGALGGTGSTAGVTGTAGAATSLGSLGLAAISKLFGVNLGGTSGGISTATGTATGTTATANPLGVAGGTTLQSPLAGLGSITSLGSGSGSTDIASTIYSLSQGMSLPDFSTPAFDFSSTFGDYTNEYYAEGGRVPGAGRGDIVPAMLEPGEFVVRRTVAERLGGALDLLNGGGSGRAVGGRLHFADGGSVDLSGLSGVQTTALLQALLLIQQQQLATQQQTAANTGQTAVALTGSQAPAPSAGATQIVGTGGAARPTTSGGSGSTASGGGGSSSGPSDTSQLLAMLSGVAGLGSQTAKLGNLLLGPGATAPFTRNLNSSLGILSGSLGLATGIASGNTLQSVGGGLSVLSGVTNLTGVQSFLNSTFGTSVLGSGSTALSAGGLASSALGVAGGALGLYSNIESIIKQGVSAGNVTQALLNAYQLYSAAAPIINAVAGTTLPTFTSIATSALTSSGVGTAALAALGIGEIGATGVAIGAPLAGAALAGGTAVELASLGATAVEVGATVGTSVAPAVATTLGGAVAGVAGFAAPAAIVMAIKAVVDIIEAVNKKNQIDSWVFRAKQDLRTVIPEIIETVPKTANEVWGVVNNPNASVADLQAAYTRAHSAIDLYNTYSNYFTTGTGAYGYVEVPQLIEIGKQLQPFLQTLQLEVIRGADRLTTMGAPPPASDPLLKPLSLGLSVGLPLTSNEGAVQGLQTYGYLDPNNLIGAAQGTTKVDGMLVPTDLYNQVAGTVQPGHLEQGLLALSNLYGTSVPDAWKTLGFGTAGGAAITGLQKQDTGALSRLAQAITPSDSGLAGAVLSSVSGGGSPTQAIQPTTFYSSLAGGASPDAAAQYAAMAQADYYQAFTSGGMATGGVVTGGIPGRDSVPKLLMPGERVLTVAQNKEYERGMQGGGPGPVTINITVNGHVDDPEEMARILAPKLRDELRRIEPRYSRAGNKTQV